MVLLTSNSTIAPIVVSHGSANITPYIVLVIVLGVLGLIAFGFITKFMNNIQKKDLLKKSSLTYLRREYIKKDLALNEVPQKEFLIFKSGVILKVKRKKLKENLNTYILMASTFDKMLGNKDYYIAISKESYDGIKIEMKNSEKRVYYFDNIDFEYARDFYIETKIMPKFVEYTETDLNWRIFSEQNSENYLRAQTKNAIIGDIENAGLIETDKQHNQNVAKSILAVRGLHTIDMGEKLQEITDKYSETK
jgi:hypothetical protein